MDLEEDESLDTPSVNADPDRLIAPEYDTEPARFTHSGDTSSTNSNASDGAEYQLKEITPMNVDLGMAEYLRKV